MFDEKMGGNMVGKTSWRYLMVGMLILVPLFVASCGGALKTSDEGRNERFLTSMVGGGQKVPFEVTLPNGEVMGTVKLERGKGVFLESPGGEQILMWEQKAKSDLWGISLLENPPALRTYYTAPVRVPPSIKGFHRDINLETGEVKNWKMRERETVQKHREMERQLGGVTGRGETK